jgi:Ca-activated chloride channel family protein
MLNRFFPVIGGLQRDDAGDRRTAVAPTTLMWAPADRVGMTVSLSATADSATLPPSGGSPTVKVSFSTTGKTKTSRRQVVLCVDTSSSMGSDDEDGVRKIERAKRGATQVLDELNPDDELAVVGFDSDPEVVVPMDSWGALTESAAVDAIDSLVASGGTDVYEALERSWREFGDAGPAVARRIVLLSDGQDFTPVSKYRSLAGDVADDGISIVAAGIGAAYNEDVMIGLAEGSNGTPKHLTAATDMESFFREVVSEAGTVVASNPELAIETGEGFRLEEAFVTPPNPRTTDVSAGDESATIPLPDLTADEDIAVTVRLLAPPRDPGIEYRLATFELLAEGALDEASVDVEYVTSEAVTPAAEGIRVAHADAKVSAGLRDTATATTDVRETIDEIERANDGWDDVVTGLRRKLTEAETEEGGAITSGLTKIDPE